MVAPVATVTKGVTRTRVASPFIPSCKVTVSVHKSTEGFDGNPKDLGLIFSQAFHEVYAVRTVSRTRNIVGKKSNGPASLMVYVAPLGYEFPKAATPGGVRLDSDTANLLRSLAVQMGLDPTDPAAINTVARALIAKVTK